MSSSLRTMSPRERVFAALGFAGPDVVPVEYHASPAGSYEHGEKLHRLWERYPSDFGASEDFPRAGPDPQWVDQDGHYSELRRDEWGVLRKHNTFGVVGHPLERPLDDWAGLSAFRLPPLPATSGPDFERAQARARRHRQCYFLKSGWISLFEVMHAVRRFEDVLMDIAIDAPEINRLADRIMEHQTSVIGYLLRRGVDAIQFGDDFATQSTLMLSPAVWRRFFKPRYAVLMKPIQDSGKMVFFHSCGCGRRILEDLAELKVDAIWPQLNAYNNSELAKFCREARVAIALHPDRGDLMSKGTPDQVRQAIYKIAEPFALPDGGCWFYVEIDSGFPFDNVKALVETIGSLRGF
jgi:uroporphyrinogen decarboxylase